MLALAFAFQLWFQTDGGSKVTSKHSKGLCLLLLLSHGLDQFALITCVWIASVLLYSRSGESSDTALAMLLGHFVIASRYQGSLGNLQSPFL